MKFRNWLRDVKRRIAKGLSGAVPAAACVVATIALAGCASPGPASVAGGECKVFSDPGFAVQGKRLKDKQWVGKTQEQGIRVCGWRRPKN